MPEVSKHEFHTEATSLPEQVKELLEEQKADWSLAQQNYLGLQKVESKIFDFGDFQIQVQFNPERIRSSAAKVDAKTIAERPCFLCEKNSPPEQNSIDYRGKYLIRINPFPIFEQHLTISLHQHVPQEIEPYFLDMLELSQDLSDFTIFYNGPRCGASAPDHFHFQAVGKNQLPIENEFAKLPAKYIETIREDEILKLSAVNGTYFRKVIVLSSSSKKQLKKEFTRILNLLKQRGQEGEPMMNVVCNFENNSWTIFVFPRDLQRSSHYFETGEKQLVVSPASVEMSGLVILPRNEDFEKITPENLEDIYQQVTINNIDFETLAEQLKHE